MRRRFAEALCASMAAALVATGWAPSTAAAPARPDAGTPSGGCTRPYADARVRCLFDATGRPETWVVPAEVSFLQVRAWGAQGGSVSREDGDGVPGGRGRGVSLQVDVRGGETLTITVGARGAAPADRGTAPGGFGGGGAGGRLGGGGGGATTVSDAGGRWIVVGGGGGATAVTRAVDSEDAGDADARSPRPRDRFVQVGTRAVPPQSGRRGGDGSPCATGASVTRTVGFSSGRRGRTFTSGGDGGSGTAGGGGGGWVGGGAGRVADACDPLGHGGGEGSDGIRADRPGSAFEVEPIGKTGDGRLSLEYHAYDVDGAPSLVLDRAAGSRTSNPGAPVRLSAIFSEPVTGFTRDDVRVTGVPTDALRWAVAEVAPHDGTSYEITVRGAPASLSLRVSVLPGSAADRELCGNTASAVVADAGEVRPARAHGQQPVFRRR